MWIRPDSTGINGLYANAGGLGTPTPTQLTDQRGPDDLAPSCSDLSNFKV